LKNLVLVTGFFAFGVRRAARRLFGNVNLIWPHRARLIWPHLVGV